MFTPFGTPRPAVSRVSRISREMTGIAVAVRSVEPTVAEASRVADGPRRSDPLPCCTASQPPSTSRYAVLRLNPSAAARSCVEQVRATAR